MNYLVKQNLEIEDWQAVCQRIERSLGGKHIDEKSMRDFIETNIDTCIYLDDKMVWVSPSSPSGVYAWVDTGYETKNGEPIFVSLCGNGTGYFVGNWVGCPTMLSQKVVEYYPRNKKAIKRNLQKFMKDYRNHIADRTVKHLIPGQKDADPKGEGLGMMSEIARKIQDAGFANLPEQPEENIGNQSAVITNKEKREEISKITIGTAKVPVTDNEVCDGKLTEVTEAVFANLLFPNWKSIYGLDRYLKIIGDRMVHLIEENKTEYFAMNGCRSIIVNTGLMNRYGNDYRIMYRYHVGKTCYEAFKIMESKVDFIEEGFTREQAAMEIKPIAFFDKEDEYFCPNWENVDFTEHAMEHIVSERRDRFPENLQTMTDHEIAERVRVALERGVRMQQRDRSYVKALYSTQTSGISWVMPLHISTKLTEKPELVLVIRKDRSFYQVKTILPYDEEMQDRIMAMSLYSNMW